MNSDLEKLIVPALIGFAAWLVKDVAFGFVQRIKDIERAEWEYRLKEIYCPLYFWSGLLTMQMEQQRAYDIGDRLQEIMARATYVVPKVYYYTLVKLLQSVHGQETAAATDSERDAMRLYLYNQIEAINMLLYRSEYLGGSGDPSASLSPQRRWLRLLLIGMGHLVTWLLVALLIGGLLWLYQRRHVDIMGAVALVLLVLLLMYVRRRADVRTGLEQRILGRP